MREQRAEDTPSRTSDRSISPRRPERPPGARPDGVRRSEQEGSDRKIIRLQPHEPAPEQSLLERLLERKVVQWFLAYLAFAWILLQLTEVLAGMWPLPVPLQRGISLSLGLGVFPALVVAWYHGEMGRQRVCWAEIGTVGAMLLGTAATVWRLCFL